MNPGVSKNPKGHERALTGLSQWLYHFNLTFGQTNYTRNEDR